MRKYIQPSLNQDTVNTRGVYGQSLLTNADFLHFFRMMKKILIMGFYDCSHTVQVNDNRESRVIEGVKIIHG